MSEQKRQDNSNIDASPEPEPEETELAGSLVELVLAAHENRQKENPILPDRIDGIVIGIVSEVNAGGDIRISLPAFQHTGLLQARALCACGEADIGRQVALIFEGGDSQKPVILGFFYSGEPPAESAETSRPSPREATADGERLVFQAEKEIVLQCGQASITLTRAGKIIIRGAYVLTRSSGVNRIQGGSVQIN